MPIKSLTTGRSGRLPRLGKIKKGAEKPKTGNAPGKNLDHFRLHTNFPEVAEKFKLVYGEQPKALDCLIPQPTVELAFPCWMEEWGKLGLVRRCDEESQHIWLDTKTGKPEARSPKPCEKAIGNACNCQKIGRLQIILPKIGELGYFEVETHGLWDIIGLTSQLQAVQDNVGRLTGIPFLLERTAQVVNRKFNATDHVLSIRVHPSCAEKIVKAVEIKAFKSMGIEMPAALPAADDWKDKGWAWATREMGVDPDIARQLLEDADSKKEYFQMVTEYCNSQRAIGAPDDETESPYL